MNHNMKFITKLMWRLEILDYIFYLKVRKSHLKYPIITITL